MLKRSTSDAIGTTIGDNSQDEKSSKDTSLSSTDATPAVPATVVVKLLAFTLAMIAAPIGMYFGTVNLVFRGNSTWAGATAALTANAVLIGYIVVAMKEDQSESEEAKQSAKKIQ